MALARTQYVRSGDADIAYQVIGEGPHDVVVVLDWASHLETLVEQPFIAEWFAVFAGFARVLWIGTRGVGMSGPIGDESLRDAWVRDLVVVMDEAGFESATLVTHGLGAQMGLVAAATLPERVQALVVVNGYARFARGEDYPIGLPDDMREAYLDTLERQWGTGVHSHGLGPSVVERPGVVEWWARVERFGATPRVARSQFEVVLALDVRDVLSHIAVPTLIIHNRGNVFVRVGHGRYLADHVPHARYLERDSPDHWPVPEEDLTGAIEEFITGTRTAVGQTGRVLATILFVDVVGSTRFAAEVGDRTWQVALERFEQMARTELAAFEGQLENTTGDGFVATFPSTARAIRCARRIHEEAGHGGLEVRSGVHAGEISRRGDGISGLAVHIAARACDLAAPGEVLVTRTVRDLVVGSGIALEERGEHELKGIPDTWALYAAVG